MWKVGITVVSNDKYSKDMIGIIWKITDEAIHVKFGTNEEDNITFQKFFFNPKHHMQSNILDLNLYNN